MPNSVQVERIVDEIKIMDYYAKLEILEKVVRLLREPVKKSKQHYSLLQLEGLGKEIWQDVNVNEYIDRERDSWD
jgi:hypothetical protein